MNRTQSLLLILVCLLPTVSACGGEPYGHEEDPQKRAGWPLIVKKHALPTDTRAYVGYYVGGGAPWCGDQPCASEGTWGWDYSGCLFHRRVMLGWFHRKYQGGIGAYRTVEPNLDSKSTP